MPTGRVSAFRARCGRKVTGVARAARGRAAPPRQRMHRSDRRKPPAPYLPPCSRGRRAHRVPRCRGINSLQTRPAMSPATPSYERIAFVASPIAEAREAFERLTARYGNAQADTADVIVALGGDGLMLHTLHRFRPTAKPADRMHPGPRAFYIAAHPP